ncbi:MBL fold metallo-hydrolase [Salipiger sp.]|uniref:MBL fold metallo-hydrolase n=1 Tax=Salipiger sp. TaxID=2078585 RepID=UPI003A96C5A1
MSLNTPSADLHRTRVGLLTFYAFHEGRNHRPLKPDLVRNAAPETVALALRGSGMAEGNFTLTVTVFGLERDGELILFDVGFGPGGPGCTGLLTQGLAAAGFGVHDVTDIVITHFHGDHILGLTGPRRGLAFPQARIHVPEPEWNFWMSGAQEATAPDRIRHAFPQARRVFDAAGPQVSRFG